jgi:hypothetical protein
MKESAKDIQQYMNIIDGNFGDRPLVTESSVDCGIHTAGAGIGDTYLFENGIRWARIIKEEGNYWLLECGLLEYDADDEIYLSKRDMTDMIVSGEMILEEIISSSEQILVESTNDNGFEPFLEGVNRYLLKNVLRESDEFEYNWRDAYNNGLTPIEAAEEAIFLED